MALVLADVGADLILGTFFNSTAQQNLKLKLYATDVTPADTDTHASYTEATGGDYAAKTLTNNSWTITSGNDPSDAVYAEQTWTFTGALTTNGTIYGYYVTNNAENVLVYAERFASTFTPANNGDQLKLTPKFQLSKGTPS
jgi:hypothetical protein